MLIALFTGGHCLLTGVPGLAKTLLIKTRRRDSRSQLQAHPVHAGSDAGGHHRHRDPRRRWRAPNACDSCKGPIFAQIILADEINRTPPKTQAALLEAMQEYHVTAAGRTYELERPFFVLATQNPIELEGTYPLPEAQLDRFMFNVVMTYLDPEDEVRVVTQTTGAERPTPSRVLDGAAINVVSTERAGSAGRRRSRALCRAAGGHHAAGPRRQARLRRRSGSSGALACARRRR